MEKQQMLQGLMNPNHFLGDYLEVEYLEQFVNKEIQRNEEEEYGDKFSFLQMLESTETSPPFSPLTEASSFQALLKLQSRNTQSWDMNCNYNNFPEIETQIQAKDQLESCITHEMLDSKLESSIKFQNSASNVDNGNSGSSPAIQKSPASCRERKKRKRTTRVSKNKEEVENQRMTHIAVERNRRRQMNEHLHSLKSLMPPSYVQRGDQASIIGGAIDFVKELEQLLQSLQGQKRMKKSNDLDTTTTNSPSPPLGLSPVMSMHDPTTTSNDGYGSEGGRNGEFRAENISDSANIDVTVIQTHVNLKIQCGRKHGQLLKLIVALEDLRLTILHLNITSFESSVLYSINLKIEEDCKIGSADGIARSVHQIFNLINGS